MGVRSTLGFLRKSRSSMLNTELNTQGNRWEIALLGFRLNYTQLVSDSLPLSIFQHRPYGCNFYVKHQEGTSHIRK